MGFTTRTLTPFAKAGAGVSQFLRGELPGVREVFDRAESDTSLAIAARAVLPSDLLDGVGTPISTLLSRLNTLPASSPADASPMPSRAPAHGSGPVWLAKPSPYDSCIRYSSPVIWRFPKKFAHTPPLPR
jgi:hypothetical protein